MSKGRPENEKAQKFCDRFYRFYEMNGRHPMVMLFTRDDIIPPYEAEDAQRFRMLKCAKDLKEKVKPYHLSISTDYYGILVEVTNDRIQ